MSRLITSPLNATSLDKGVWPKWAPGAAAEHAFLCTLMAFCNQAVDSTIGLLQIIEMWSMPKNNGVLANWLPIALLLR